MTPKRIAHANLCLGAPPDWDEKRDGPCVKLWVRQEGDRFLSAWEPTPEELAALNAGAPVVLSIVGGQPPVWVSVGTPIAPEECPY